MKFGVFHGTLQAEQLAGVRIRMGVPPREKLSLLGRLRRAFGMFFHRGRPGSGVLVLGDVAPGEPGPSGLGFGAPSQRRKQKEKARRKKARASRRRNK